MIHGLRGLQAAASSRVH